MASKQNIETKVASPERPQLLQLGLNLLLQLICALPFFQQYGSWHNIEPWFLSEHAARLSAAYSTDIAGQLALAQIVALLTAVVIALFISFFSKPVSANKSVRLVETILIPLLFGLLAQCLVMTRCLQLPMTLDDPFIDFRYVQNWLAGIFDYNPGQHIQGYSSPLHLATVFACTKLASLLAIPNSESVHPAAISNVCNIILQICNLILVFAIAQRGLKSKIFAVVAAAVYTFGASSMLAAIDNKESALMQFLIFMSLLAAVAGKYRQWCPYSALALSMTRPEGIIWTIREILSDVIDGGIATVKRWLPTIAVLGVWYGFVYSYYGTVVPHGALGRANMFHSSPHLTVHACPFILTTLGIDTFKHLFIYWPTASDYYAPIFTFQELGKGMVALIVLVFYVHRLEWLRSYAYNLIAIFAFFAIFDPWMFSWYYSWFTPVAVFLVPLMMQSACNLIREAAKNKTPLGKTWQIAWGTLLLLLVTLPQMIDINLFNWLSAPSDKRETAEQYLRARASETLFVINPAIERLNVYKVAADYLASTEGGKFNTLATWEPGVLGYYLPKKTIIDLGGLVSDEVLKYYPVPVNERSRKDVWGSIPVQAVMDLKPDRVILLDSFGNNGLLKNRGFLEQYKLTKFWPIKLWQGQGFLLFERVADTRQLKTKTDG